MRKYMLVEGKSNEKIPEASTDMYASQESEESKALKIILGLEEQASVVSTFRIEKESPLIKRAREFRAEFEKMQSNK